jgi:hypothetical protein
MRRIPWDTLRSGWQQGVIVAAVARLLFALVLFDIYWSMGSNSGVAGISGQEHPVGLARLFDLTWLGQREVIRGQVDGEWWRPSLLWFFISFALLYVSGWRPWVWIPYLTMVVLLPTTLYQSQGSHYHHLQLALLVLLFQGVAAIYWRYVKGWRGREINARLGWVAVQICVAVYLVTAITKVEASDGKWISNAKYFPIQLVKTHQAEHYNTLQPPGQPSPPEEGALRWLDGATGGMVHRLDVRLGEWSGEMVEKMMGSPGLCQVILSSGLLLEFLVILALWGRGWAFLMGVMVILFHLSVGRLMNLHFDVNIMVVTIFMLDIPHWISRVPTLLAPGRRVEA